MIPLNIVNGTKHNHNQNKTNYFLTVNINLQIKLFVLNLAKHGPPLWDNYVRYF